MYIARYKKTKTDTPSKNCSQQKSHPLMSFENNGTLQKWYMTNILPKINKYDGTHNKWYLIKMVHLAKKCTKLIC